MNGVSRSRKASIRSLETNEGADTEIDVFDSFPGQFIRKRKSAVLEMALGRTWHNDSFWQARYRDDVRPALFILPLLYTEILRLSIGG